MQWVPKPGKDVVVEEVEEVRKRSTVRVPTLYYYYYYYYYYTPNHHSLVDFLFATATAAMGDHYNL